MPSKWRPPAALTRNRGRGRSDPGGRAELVSGNVPGGGRTNRQHFGARIVIAPSAIQRGGLLFDPQTSGGLLVAIDPAAAETTLTALRAIASRPWRSATSARGVR